LRATAFVKRMQDFLACCWVRQVADCTLVVCSGLHTLDTPLGKLLAPSRRLPAYSYLADRPWTASRKKPDAEAKLCL
jgi:hypothetical protein